MASCICLLATMLVPVAIIVVLATAIGGADAQYLYPAPAQRQYYQPGAAMSYSTANNYNNYGGNGGSTTTTTVVSDEGANPVHGFWLFIAGVLIFAFLLGIPFGLIACCKGDANERVARYKEHARMRSRY
ncbi:MAG: hypothetical protein WC763_06275 [Candidatus Paceibacterota bacterium]